MNIKSPQNRFASIKINRGFNDSLNLEFGAINDIIKKQMKIVNSPSFQNTIKVIQKQANIMQSVYKNTIWVDLVRQQTEIRKSIFIAHKRMADSQFGAYRELLKNNLYLENGSRNIEKASRVAIEEIGDTIDIFEKEATKKNDTETLVVITKVKNLFDLENGKKFKVLYSPRHELFIVGDKKNKIIKFKSGKILKLLSVLANSNKFIPTETLMEFSDYSSYSSVHNAISTLNKKFVELGFIKDKAIEGK